MASKWNRLASCIISFLSCRFSLACSMTMMRPTRKHVASSATPVSVMLRPGVMKSLASHSDGWLVGYGIMYTWELGIICGDTRERDIYEIETES